MKMWLRRKLSASCPRGERVIIYDNGTPACLPAWACEEIVRLRLKTSDLRFELWETRVALRQAQGMTISDALDAE